MTAVITFRPFKIYIAEILPCMVVVCLMLIAKGCIQTVFIEKSDTKPYAAAIIIGSCLKKCHQAEQYCKHLLHIYFSSNNT